jgi:hypothetical protein
MHSPSLTTTAKTVTMVQQPDGKWCPTTKEEYDKTGGFFLAKAREVINQTRESQRRKEESKRDTTPWRPRLLRRPVPLPVYLSQNPTSPASELDQSRKSDEDILLEKQHNNHKRTAPLSPAKLTSYPSSENDSDEPPCKPFGKKHRFLPYTPPETPPYLSPTSPCSDLGDDSYYDNELLSKESGRRTPLRAAMTMDETQHRLANQRRITTSSLGHCDHLEPCASPAECFLKYMDKHYTAAPASPSCDHIHNNIRS